MTRRSSKQGKTVDNGAGVSKQSRTHTHLAKDGLYYGTYEFMANANKLANEKRIQALGLDNFHSKSRKARKKTASPRKSSSSPLASTRSSKRIRREPAPPKQELVDDTDLKRRRSTMKSPLRKRPQLDVTAVSPTDRPNLGKQYKDPSVWMQAIKSYWVDQEGLSNQNLRSVMRQVSKLCTGEGVTYKRWPEQAHFCKGEEVDLSWDLDALYDQACEYENKHGRDLGNGWLLRHPIKKMENFQRFLSSPSSETKQVN